MTYKEKLQSEEREFVNNAENCLRLKRNISKFFYSFSASLKCLLPDTKVMLFTNYESHVFLLHLGNL